jgi:hypothetical protein
MRKAVIAAMAAAIALAPISVLAASWTVHATPQCPGPTPTPAMEACYCAQLAGSPYNGYENCLQAEHQVLQQEMQLPCPDNKRRILDPPYCVGDTGRTPATTPAQPPNTSPVKPAQAPVTKPAPVAPPKGLEAPPESVTAAKNAPATRVDPANPPKPPTQQDFHQQVQNVISAHGGNVDVVKAGNQTLVRPRHWNWLDYDADHHPALYNPLTEAMTFRYFYNGARREVYVAAGSRVVLEVATTGTFPFTAVSDSYVASGSFYGGTTPPTVYQNVTASIPAANQSVQVGQVTVVGHDPNQPAGSQDTFMLDDSTLAWGQVNDPRDGGQITVTKTQPLPGVGPSDDGSFLVALATQEQPSGNTWWLWLVGGGVLVIVAGAGLVAWIVVRRKRTAYPTVGA